MLKLETTADLQAVIDGGIGESLHLDFKRGDALAKSDGKKREMAKDVSAMANSDGGQIIYGIDEDGAGNATSWAPPADRSINADWIGQVLDQNVSPRIEGLRIREIPAPGSGLAFVVAAPRAITRAPHQASDKRYYRRHERESVPMYDYEVREAMRRLQDPQLYCRFSLGIAHPGLMNNGREGLQIACHIGNRSSVPALYVSLSIFVDARLAKEQFVDWQDFLAKKQTLPSGQEVHRFKREFCAPRDFPVFRESRIEIKSAGFLYPSWMTPDDEIILGYSLACPGFQIEDYQVAHRQNGRFEFQAAVS
ncbi:hypothetical protein ASE63_18465 [Bosea sp. Root381]|uniref:AlbA family DNA-binding domain-containing protein n=1 Tax=Bosea sp. Root381 TaxID=1736524 RepID=UPI0006F83115|nr:ATP-binding protein [Bosea sp. Root381]KRE13457.1 hypothetical protein ASE63_18465 [Bosea sp. Root381]